VTPTRTAVALVGAALALTACAAERSAPVLTRPPPPSTTTTTEPPPTTTEAPAVALTTPSTTTAPPRTISTTPTARQAAWAEFDRALASRLLGSGDFAVSVAVAVDGDLVHTGAFGYRVPPPYLPPRGGGTVAGPAPTAPRTTVRGQRPDGVEENDRFRIASISKILTATVVLQLVESAYLGLDQPVGQLLADHVGVRVQDPAIAGITVRQLLSHTSGLSGYDYLFFGGAADSCTNAARAGLSGRLIAPPATRYIYSNLGYCLLGLLVEQVTNRPYEVEVRERLLEPLGIKGMRLAATFDRNAGEVQHPSVPTRNYMEVLAAAGAWTATPADLVRILDALDPAKPGWHPLSKRMLDLMRRPMPTVPYPRSPQYWYGLGLMVATDGSWWHTGTVESTHAMVFARPDGVTWSVLVSGNYPGETDDLQRIFDETVAASGVRFD
jgi:D-alanyl-D-alanine carboxypeptidase